MHRTVSKASYLPRLGLVMLAGLTAHSPAVADPPFAGTIVYAVNESYGRTTLHILNWPSKEARVLPDAVSSVNNAPQWEPYEYQWIYFHAGFGAANIWRVRADGTGLGKVFDSGGDDLVPTLAPRADEISYSVANTVRVVRNDGSGDVFLAPGFNPRWSPNGSEIAFDHNGDIWIYDLVRDVSKRVTKHDFGESFYEVDYAPSGHQLAATRAVAGTTDVVVMNRDGSGLVNATSDIDDAAAAPAWSPDGKYIVFTRARPGQPRDLWVMQSSGSDMQQLTFTPEADEEEPDVAPLPDRPADSNRDGAANRLDLFDFLGAVFLGFF